MLKKFFFSLFVVSVTTLFAKPMIDCRVGTGEILECNPYGKRFHIAQEINYDRDRKSLIVVKTLPTPNTHRMKVISVKAMMDKYIHFDDSVLLKEAKPKPIKLAVTHKTDKPLLIKKKTYPIDLKSPQIFIEQKTPIKYGTYTVVSGDSLSFIAYKFSLETKALTSLNNLTREGMLRIGQKLKLPYDPIMIKAFNLGKYTVQEGDTLISIAKTFNVYPRDIIEFNDIRDATTVRKGKVLKLPLPYVLDSIKKKKRTTTKKPAENKLDMIGSLGTYKLRVTATAYTSHEGQTDDTPFLAAWNNRLVPGEKSIAVSRDLLSRFGMRNGTKVRISGLRGYYEVRDKMNKRYKKRIDIYMGLDIKKALKWGKRSVVIYW